MDGNPPEPSKKFERIFDFYRKSILVDVEDYLTNKAQLMFPTLTQETIENLCENASRVFRKEPALLKLTHDFIVVGDLHGHILDLFRILRNFGLPPAQKYLFLGDIVDRGEFSIETITLVLLLKVLYPEHVYVIRGNHEFAEMCQRGGFGAEILKMYGNKSLETAFLCAFSWIPIGAIINDTILCIHGGIGPNINSLEELANTPRPMYGFDSEPATTVLWSDPVEKLIGYKPSSRGSGYFFGADALTEFLTKMNLTMVVRAHECVNDGVHSMWGSKLVTVFSASYYCGISQNRSGVLVLLPTGEREIITFPPLNYLRRTMAHHVRISPAIAPIRPPPRDLDAPPSAMRVGYKLPSLSITDQARDLHPHSNTGRPTGMKLNRGNVRTERSISGMANKRFAQQLMKVDELSAARRQPRVTRPLTSMSLKKIP